MRVAGVGLVGMPARSGGKAQKGGRRQVGRVRGVGACGVRWYNASLTPRSGNTKINLQLSGRDGSGNVHPWKNIPNWFRLERYAARVRPAQPGGSPAHAPQPVPPARCKRAAFR